MNKDFSLIPQVRFNRSKFKMPHGVKTSMSVGTLYPIAWQEVLPGDTFQSNLSCVARVTSAFLKPVVDNAWVDIYHFFVPGRLVYDDFEKVFGDPNPSAYNSNTLATIPAYTSSITVSEKTVFDYLGLPLGTVPKGVSVLPARAFALIYDKWFRNENVTNEMYIQKGSLQSSETPNNNAWAPNNYVGKLPKVNKKKDYFTSCLPKTQKGVSVALPLGTVAPVYAGKTDIPSIYASNALVDVLRLKEFTGWDYSHPTTQLSVSANTGEVASVNTTTPAGQYGYTPANLWSDLSNATAANINDIRFAFQLQKMLERDALYGSRYNEYLLAHYGVTSPDARLQLPEYLGGGRFPITMQEVAQTSEASSTSPLGNVAAFSLTNGQSRFSKGFVEHGYIFTVACIRTMHTYQQGVPKKFTRLTRNDFYDPFFANLGEQPVYRSELYVDGTETTLHDNVFGYNEAWADYRYIPNVISGEMRSSATNSFDIWHFADNYASAPTLSQSFVEETASNINRTLAVPSESSDPNVKLIDNFLCDFYFDTTAIRVMPTYSIPGLVDHH